MRKAISRIEAKGHRGVLLLHDIHPATAMALPTLLKELKAKGYKIVQAVPVGERPKSVPENPTPAVANSGGWPRVVETNGSSAAEHSEQVIKTTRHRKRLARHHRDSESAASMVKKKHKTKTAAAGVNRIQR